MTPEFNDHEPVTDALRIGRYRVDAVIGTGAFATVYRAVDERLDDTVAVKVLAENHSFDPELRERFLTEGRVLRRVASRHVVAVHDLGETARQQPYLVLEYADRGTLVHRVPDLLARGWRPQAGDLWAVAAPLVEALDAIHRAGVVHRDVNPANVLLTTRGAHAHDGYAAVTAWGERLVLADLGLCKDLALNSGYTSAGGTEGFRPPELRRGPAMIDARADLWSLSALLVWLATGSPPGEHTASALLSGTDLPPGLSRALDRSLAVDPSARHPDVRTWWAEVAAALSAPPTPFTAPVVPTGSPAPRTSVTQWPGTPADDGRPTADHGWAWRLRHSAWVLAALPLGLTTWAGFLYIGLRADRRAWKWAAAGYGAAALAIAVLAILSPTATDGQVDDGAWQSILGMIVLAVTWLGGLGHAFAANAAWLRWCRHGTTRAHRLDPHPPPV